MARRKKHEEHENHERWLVSYADFITLLFAFFVVMYSVSSVNEGKYRVLSNALTAAFRSSNRSLSPIQLGNPIKAPSHGNPYDLPRVPSSSVIELPQMPLPRPEREESRGRGKPQAHARTNRPGVGAKTGGGPTLKQISERVIQAMDSLIKQKVISVSLTRRWVKVQINSRILFRAGSADLVRQARPTLLKLADVLKGFPNPVQVEGFTDNTPINNVIFRSNWDLSAGRAATVVHLFAGRGVSPKRLVAMGFGEFRPIADNSTAAGRRKNRRVVLVIKATKNSTHAMAEALKQLEPKPKPKPRPKLNPKASAKAVAPATQTAQRPAPGAIPGWVHQRGEFPVIAPPIRLPIVSLSAVVQRRMHGAETDRGSAGGGP